MRLAHRQVQQGAAIAAAAVTALAGAAAGQSAPDAKGSVAATEYRVLLTSNRDGSSRAYSVRSDGSRLTPLLRPGRRLTPAALSRDGKLVAFESADDGNAIYVSRADGSGLRRLVRRPGAYGPSFSRDGKLLAFSSENGIWIVGVNGKGLRHLTTREWDRYIDWSPDGKSFAFSREHDDVTLSVIVQPLHGRARTLVRTKTDDFLPVPAWSPDGRWIAYHLLGDDDRLSLWVVRPDGRARHRVGPGVEGDSTARFAWSPDGRWIADANDGLWLVRPSGAERHLLTPEPAFTFAWSPDSTRLAFAVGSDVAVVGADGRGPKRVRLEASSVSALVWSPDGRRVALSGRVEYAIHEIWTVGSELSGLRQVTSEGTNGLVGWTPLAPVLPAALPLPPTERVVGTDAVATRAPIGALSADGARVAVTVKPTATDCEHLVVWTPGETGLIRLGPRPAPCPREPEPRRITELTLAGSRVAWALMHLAFALYSAELADRVPLVFGGCDGCPSSYEFHAHGDGDLLVFNSARSQGWQLIRVGGGAEPCPTGPGNTADIPTARPSICTTLRRGEHAATVESVAGGLIATHERETVAVLNARGEVVRLFPFAPADVSAARLDGGRLVVWRVGVLEVYDVATGARELTRVMPAGYRLAEVYGGIAVLLRADSVQLLRLADGRSLTLTPGREPALADLEPAGLYHAYATPEGGGRLVFVPRAEVVRRLESGAS
jgi:Tol biopolymer transport system component